MDMSEVHLEPDEIAYLEEFAEPISSQVDEISMAFIDRDHIRLSHLVAELCMYHFTLGREFQKRETQNHA